jgi:oligopeptide/dipeptide ABC transporter ATP-binding protein
MSIMFITHDLGVIAEMSEKVIVMYAGHIVEQADVRSLFRNPLHPYTKGLLISKPDLNEGGTRLHVIPGNVPNLLKRPSGCQFHPRCEYVMDRCKTELPPLFDMGDGRQARCWLCETNKTEARQ